MEVSLVMFKADGSRRDFPVTKPRVVLGRTNNCDLRIPLSSVSRQHCELRAGSDRVLLRDLGSSNGTLHNGSRVQEAVLEAGDQITVGQVVFTVVIDGQPAEVQPVRSTLDGTAVSPAVPHAAPRSQPQQPVDDLGDDIVDVEELEPIDDDVLMSMQLDDGDATETTVDVDDPVAALEALAQADLDVNDDIELLDDDDKPKRR